VATHYLDEADRLADQVAIVDHGRVVISDTPTRLKSELHGDTLQLDVGSATAAQAAAAALATFTTLGDLQVDGSVVRARVDSGAAAVPAVVDRLNRAGVGLSAVTVSQPTLDDVYLHHVGRSLKEAA
jgi:ABC-2 type transport system ATP-binding protein